MASYRFRLSPRFRLGEARTCKQDRNRHHHPGRQDKRAQIAGEAKIKPAETRLALQRLDIDFAAASLPFGAMDKSCLRRDSLIQNQVSEAAFFRGHLDGLPGLAFDIAETSEIS